jgi:hypothetical protein
VLTKSIQNLGVIHALICTYFFLHCGPCYVYHIFLNISQKLFILILGKSNGYVGICKLPFMELQGNKHVEIFCIIDVSGNIC